MTTSPPQERHATIALSHWGGITRQHVVVVGETPKRYRVKCPGDKPVRLAGRWRYLQPGDTALVPKHAVAFVEDPRTLPG